MRKSYLLYIVVCFLVVMQQASTAVGCPLCPGSKQKTFSQQIATSDVVVIVRLTEKAPQPKQDSSAGNELPGSEELKKSKFRLVEVLKGEKLLGRKKVIETVLFGDAEEGSLFLMMAVQPPELIWTIPQDPLNDTVLAYIKEVMKLTAEGPQRLIFFKEYFESEQEQIAADVYNEFATTPYDKIQKIKQHLDRKKLVTWIQKSTIPVNRRRLYTMLLGTCGNAEDISMFEEMIKSTDPTKKQALDATVTSYLILKGPSGMDLIDQQIFLNKKAPFTEIYSTMMGLRVLGEVIKDVIPKERLLQSVRLLLNRPDTADSIIPDLARWEDWSVIPRLVTLFKQADPAESWVRIAIINYLKVCPKQEAKVAMRELEKIDPDAFKEAEEQFQFSPRRKNDTAKEKTKSKKKDGKSTTSKTENEKTKANVGFEEEQHMPRLDMPVPDEEELFEHRMLTVGIPLILVIGLFLILWLILRIPLRNAAS